MRYTPPTSGPRPSFSDRLRHVRTLPIPGTKTPDGEEPTLIGTLTRSEQRSFARSTRRKGQA